VKPRISPSEIDRKAICKAFLLYEAENYREMLNFFTRKETISTSGGEEREKKPRVSSGRCACSEKKKLGT